MTDLRERYLEKKREYFYNNKPERYRLHDVGMGFIVQDTLSHKNDRTDESDYHLIPEMNRNFGKEDKYKSAQDLIDELNRLDYQVNGALYDDDKYWVMNIKERLNESFRQQLDCSLSKKLHFDHFKCTAVNMDYHKGECEKIKINVDIWWDKRVRKHDKS